MEHRRSAVLGYDSRITDFFAETLVQGGYARPQRSQDVSISALMQYQPHLILIDFDHLHSDRLESTRELRFVLPQCVIAVVSSNLSRAWARKCHMAGASGVLGAGQSGSGLLAGLRQADKLGCFTDPAFGDGRNGT